MKKLFPIAVALVLCVLIPGTAVAATNLLTNGDFELPAIADGTWSYFDSVPGWTIDWVNLGNTPPGNLEFHNPPVVSGVTTSADGDQYVELDSHGSSLQPDASVRISQPVATCEGGEYQLSYAWRPRPDGFETHVMKVFVGDVLKGTHTYLDYTSDWKLETLAFSGTGGNVEIAFAEAGPGDQLGMFLDAVSVVQTKDCVEPLIVTKTANTEFDLTYTWMIDKSVDRPTLTLAKGETFAVNYTVTADRTSIDGGWGVFGTISISNPNTAPAMLTGVSDIVSGDHAMTVDCEVAFPYELVAGGTLDCAYSGDLPDAAQRVNTATVATTGDVPGAVAIADVIFGASPTVEIDECAMFSDTYKGALGELCDDGTFTYSRVIGPYEEVGVYPVENTASFVAKDSEAQGSDGAEVIATVPYLGCTLTQGYWKTHSKYGPAPKTDDTWDILPSGADTTFFLSGATYYDVLKTPPAGNAYYQLAHQYITAKLNMLNGASPADVQATFNSATTLLTAKTPAQIAALKGSDSLRKQFITLAGILGSYNEGLKGPGHCDEQVPILREKVSIPADVSSPVMSAMPLGSGKTYFMKVMGTASAGDGIEFDAKYSERNSSGSWTDAVQNYESYGPTLLDLMMNGGFVDWGAYNPLHVYTHTLAGAGAPAMFMVSDIYPSNNTGSLSVEIYEL
jgi:hypothetical protein